MPRTGHGPRWRRAGRTRRRLLVSLVAAALITVGIEAGGWRSSSADQVAADAGGSGLSAGGEPRAADVPTNGASLVADGASVLVTTERAVDRTSAAADPDTAALAWFDGRPIRRVDTLRMRVTAYSPDERSCGRFADGITASGYSVWTNGMKLAAADPAVLDVGSLISVPGYDGGAVIPVLDRGALIKGHRLDVLFPTHEEAMEWGVRDLDVDVWEYVEGGDR